MIEERPPEKKPSDEREQEETLMTIRQNREGNRLTLILGGRLDTNTAPKLKSVADSELVGVEELILDLENLEYISSAGLRVLLKIKKILGKRTSLKAIHANETVREVFDITGFLKILTVE